MITNINLNELLTFPLKDKEARKHLLVGALISMTTFVIPILPLFILVGYMVEISRQILRGESPHMVAWNDWSKLLKDGARFFFLRLVYSLPILLFTLPVVLMAFVLPFLSSESGTEALVLILFSFIILFSGLIVLVSIFIGITIPAGEMHAIEKDDFTAGFQFREWWAIFRANLGGFITAFIIYYFAYLAVILLTQIIMLTLVLACLLPIIISASSIYIMLVMYAATAQAYKDGKARLIQTQTEAQGI